MSQNKFYGHPEEILIAAKALVEHKHNGSDASDMYWDCLLDDLREAIKVYDKKYPYAPTILDKVIDKIVGTK
jgi:hypothetical protein